MEDYLLHTSYLLSVRSVRQVMDQVFAFLLWPKREAYMGHENKEAKNKDPQFAVRIEQMRLLRCLLYGFVDYSGFEKVIES